MEKMNFKNKNILFPTFAAIFLLAIFVFGRPTWIFLIQLLLVVVVLVMVIRDDVLGLLTLVVLRPTVDIMSNTVLLSVRGISINVAAALSLIVIPWAVVVLLRRGVKIRATPLFWPIMVFFSICAISIPFSIDPHVSIEEFVRLLAVFLLYVLAYHLITTPQQVRQFRVAFAISLVVPALAGIIEFVTHKGLTFGPLSNRVFGTFGHPNVFAFYLVLSLAYFAGIVSMSPKRVRREVLAGLGVLLVLLVLTLTRGAWIGFFIVAATFGLMHHRRLVAVALLVVVFLGVTFPLANRVLTQQVNINLLQTSLVRKLTDTESEDSSYRFRLQMWHEMAPKFFERPFLGHGLGSFVILRQQQIFYFFQSPEAHNDYLRLAIETGALGLVAYLTLLGMAIARLWAGVRRLGQTPAGLQTLGILGFTLALLVMNFFDNILQHTPVMWAYWLILGVTLRQATAARQ